MRLFGILGWKMEVLGNSMFYLPARIVRELFRNGKVVRFELPGNQKAEDEISPESRVGPKISCIQPDPAVIIIE